MQYIELTPAVQILEDRGPSGQSCVIADIRTEYVELMCEEVTHDMTELATRYWRAYRSHNWLWEILRVGNKKNPLARALKKSKSPIPFLLDKPNGPNGPEVFSQEIISAWGNLSGLAKPGETLLTFNSFNPDTDAHDICDTAVEKELLLAFHSHVTRVILDCLSIFDNERSKRVSNLVNSPYAQPHITGEKNTGEPCTMIACVVEDSPTAENEIAVRVLFELLNVTGIFQTPMTEEQKERADMRKMLQGKPKPLHRLAIINYPERKVASTYDVAQKPITITPSEHVIGRPVQPCDIVTCYPGAARYLVSLDRLHRHNADLAQAIDKEALTEAVAQTQWLHEERESMSDAWFRTALSDICADLIQEAAETLEA